MTRVLFHQLPGPKRATVVLREILRLYEEEISCVVWVADPGRRSAFDEYLWNYEKLAFIPHISWEEEMGKVIDPIVLLGRPANPNDAEVLVIADDPPPEDWAGDFSEIHEFIAPGEDGEERRSFWEDWQEKRK